MMQHENGADACEDWSQQIMRAGEVERSQSSPDDGVAKLLHCTRWLADRDIIQPVNEEGLKKRLFADVSHSGAFCYFRFDSPARVCFLSVSGVLGFAVPRLCATSAQSAARRQKRHWNHRVVGAASRDIGCTVFSGGAANGGRA
jgi:hypothetical protein